MWCSAGASWCLSFALTSWEYSSGTPLRLLFILPCTHTSQPASTVLRNVSFGSDSHQFTCDFLGLTRPVAMACFGDFWTEAVKSLSWLPVSHSERISHVIPITCAFPNSTVKRKSSCSPCMFDQITVETFVGRRLTCFWLPVFFCWLQHFFLKVAFSVDFTEMQVYVWLWKWL